MDFHRLISVIKLHPILVNFTAALIPVSVACDVLARRRRNEELRATAWWTLLVATIVTPFTAIAGWLFWMDDDNGVTAMTVHKWLGTAFVVVLFALFGWRLRIRRRGTWASTPYLLAAFAVVALLVVQGALGGDQVFSDM